LKSIKMAFPRAMRPAKSKYKNCLNYDKIADSKTNQHYKVRLDKEEEEEASLLEIVLTRHSLNHTAVESLSLPQITAIYGSASPRLLRLRRRIIKQANLTFIVM